MSGEATRSFLGPIPRVALRADARLSRSVEYGLAVLECFTAERPVLGIADMADMLGIHRSTTHRYMSTLVELGFLQQDSKRKYRLTLRVTGLGMSAMSSTSLEEHSRFYVEELRRRSGYTVSVAVLDGPDILYVKRAHSSKRGQSPTDLDLRPGSRLPAYCTAMGKLLLAWVPDAEQDTLIADMKLGRRGPKAITNKTALLAALGEVREDGFATNDEESAPYAIAIAAPIRDENRELVATIGMVASTSVISLGMLIDQLLPHLLSSADNISARLGCRREDEVTK
jgi:IclR family transcriptional regulator, pca regulon regulatory protein